MKVAFRVARRRSLVARAGGSGPAQLADVTPDVTVSLLHGNLRPVRRQVTGGMHGIERFEAAYTIGDRLLPASL